MLQIPIDSILPAESRIRDGTSATSFVTIQPRDYGAFYFISMRIFPNDIPPERKLPLWSLFLFPSLPTSPHAPVSSPFSFYYPFSFLFRPGPREACQTPRDCQLVLSFRVLSTRDRPVPHLPTPFPPRSPVAVEKKQLVRRTRIASRSSERGYRIENIARAITLLVDTTGSSMRSA